MPTFNGDYKEWPGFKDIFLGTIDSNKSLTGTQKFQYLKSFLGKQPADLFKNTPCTDKNYIEAWEKLEERYDRSNLIVQSYIKTFLSLSSVNSPNASLLRKIFDEADEAIRGLNSLDVTTRDPWIIYILLQKLDYETKQEWAHEAGTKTDCTIQEFFDFCKYDVIVLKLAVHRSLTLFQNVEITRIKKVFGHTWLKPNSVVQNVRKTTFFLLAKHLPR